MTLINIFLMMSPEGGGFGFGFLPIIIIAVIVIAIIMAVKNKGKDGTSISADQTNQKCNSCASVIQSDAAKCPNCGEWREDIKKERNLSYLWGFIASIPTFTFFYGKSVGWWAEKPKIVDNFWENVWENAVLKQFDWATFFSSLSGMLIIFAFFIAMGVSLKYYISVSTKMKNWIWV